MKKPEEITTGAFLKNFARAQEFDPTVLIGAYTWPEDGKTGGRQMVYVDAPPELALSLWAQLSVQVIRDLAEATENCESAIAITAVQTLFGALADSFPDEEEDEGPSWRD